jgi:hypothetical protein
MTNIGHFRAAATLLDVQRDIRKQWDGRAQLNGISMRQSGDASQPFERAGASDTKVATVGIDLAKKCVSTARGQ